MLPAPPLNSNPNEDAANTKLGVSSRPTAIAKPSLVAADTPPKVAVGAGPAASIIFTRGRSSGTLTDSPRSASSASSNAPISTRSPLKTKGLSNENIVSNPSVLAKWDRSDPSPTLVSRITASPYAATTFSPTKTISPFSSISVRISNKEPAIRIDPSANSTVGSSSVNSSRKAAKPNP